MANPPKHRAMVRRREIFWALALCAGAIVHADQASDLARIHKEAIGGAARLEALHALRATGRVVTAGRELAFEMIAARPNRVRITMQAEGRTLVQGFDGAAAPWRLEPEKSAAVEMTEAEAHDFRADAEFDDPLINAMERGYTLDFAGETEWQKTRALKILVTHRDAAPSVLLLDPDTYSIVARRTTQRMMSGREVTIETRYSDFRPVAGVIFPNRIEVFAEGRLLRETVLTNVEAIAEPPPEVFAKPVTRAADGGK